MGRFKIYDPRKLVSVETNSDYGKCLLCERKLKTIMGNIKRHYEQMHSVYVNANLKKGATRKTRRSKVKKLKKNEPYKLTTCMLTLNDVQIPEKNISALENIVAPTSPCTYQNYNQTSIENPTQESKSGAKDVQLSKILDVNEQVQPVNSLVLAPFNTPFIQKENIHSDHQLPLQNSNLKKTELIEGNEEIKIPCYSFINNIKINSAETCHQLEYLKCLVESKAHVNIPLKTIENEDTFQKALRNYKPIFQFNYSPQTIGDHIDRMTKKLHQEIKKLVTNRLVYLKLDIVNKTEGNSMLVNVQFIEDFRFHVITLNALEFSDDEVATHLKKKVLSTLSRFRIDISNVFSIVKDNTNNIRKCADKNEKICENTTNTEYCQNLSIGFPGHAIHFAASDIIKQLNENISQSRDSVRHLLGLMNQLKTKSTPVLDYNTNWFSVYDMIESLINIYNESEDKSNLIIEVDWVFAKKFVESFRPIVDTAIMLQTNEIVLMGDFYREWLHCEMKLKELTVSNELALYLLEALHKRKLEFFENASFLAALYLDPRFCYMGSIYLSDKQKEIAIAHLLQIFIKLKTMPETKNILDTNLDKRYDELEEKVLNNIEPMHSSQAVSLNDINEQRVRQCLEQLQFEARLPFQSHILEYWKMAKYKNPVLAKVAENALAAPATQATLNRALNNSSTTLLKRKHSMENIENLILLKLNEDLVNNISLEA